MKNQQQSLVCYACYLWHITMWKNVGEATKGWRRKWRIQASIALVRKAVLRSVPEMVEHFPRKLPGSPNCLQVMAVGNINIWPAFLTAGLLSKRIISYLCMWCVENLSSCQSENSNVWSRKKAQNVFRRDMITKCILWQNNARPSWLLQTHPIVPCGCNWSPQPAHENRQVNRDQGQQRTSSSQFSSWCGMTVIKHSPQLNEVCGRSVFLSTWSSQRIMTVENLRKPREACHVKQNHTCALPDMEIDFLLRYEPRRSMCTFFQHNIIYFDSITSYKFTLRAMHSNYVNMVIL